MRLKKQNVKGLKNSKVFKRAENEKKVGDPDAGRERRPKFMTLAAQIECKLSWVFLNNHILRLSC